MATISPSLYERLHNELEASWTALFLPWHRKMRQKAGSSMNVWTFLYTIIHYYYNLLEISTVHETAVLYDYVMSKDDDWGKDDGMMETYTYTHRHTFACTKWHCTYQANKATELNWTELNQHEKPLSRTKGMYIYDSNLCSRVLFWRNWLYWNERRKPCLAAALPTLVHTGSCIYQPCGTLARLLLPFIHFSVYLFSCSPCTYTFYISTTRRNKKKENTIHNTSPSSNPFHLFHLLYYT